MATTYLYVKSYSDQRHKRFYCSASVFGKYGIRYWMTLVLFALVLIGPPADAQTPTSSLCSGATGVCTGSSYSFPASTGAGAAETGASYGCLTTRPNPAWFFMQIQNPGSITITMTTSPAEDIDFAIWGPFTDPFSQCVAGLTAAKRVACSYSTATTETGTIPNGLAGEYYVLLITNFSDDPTNISFSQTGGTGTSNCAILCNITGLTATPSACGTGAGAGTYTVSGTVTTFTPPTTGTLTITSSCGGSVTYNAPFSTSQAYTLPAQVGQGGTCTVTASYSALSTCTRTASITAPNCCTVTAGADFNVCQGSSINLTATGSSGGTYYWTGPNGFTSSAQNPTITNATSAKTGTYSVYLVNGACTSAVDNIVVTLSPVPDATVTPDGSLTICAGEDVVLSVPSGAGLTYQWKRNGTNIGGATSSSYTATTSGTYTVVVSNTGCGFTAATSSNQVVVVNALPTTATITASGATTFCAGDSVTLTANTGTGLTYQWTLGGVDITGATALTYVAKVSGSYRVVVTNTNGCSLTSSAQTVTVNALPTATITPADSAKFCQGGSVALAANTGTGLTYQWYLNGGALATTSGVNAGIAGNYTVTVTNASGCKKTSTTTVVSKYANPAATVTAASAVTFCQGGSVTLNANTAIGFTYQWKLNGTNISGATTSSYTASTSGTYTVTVAQSFCSGLAAVTSSNTVVTVNTLPTATITPSGATTFCQGDSVTLSANTGTGFTYKWSLGGAIISGATASTYIAKVAGNYRVTVTNSNGCKDSSAITTITLNTLPTATITPSGATTFCQGDSVTLSANTGTGLTYKWSLNAAIISGATASTYKAKVAGNYRVTVTNSNGCKDSSAITAITVNTLPTATITPSGATTFCQGDSVTLSANTGTGLTYQWSLNAAIISGATASTYKAKVAGNYRVTVTNSNGCKDSSAITAITVNALPTATITPSGATTFCQGDSVTLSANTGAGLTYKWSLNAAIISGATASTYIAKVAGNYRVTVTNSNGCKDSSAITVITLNALPTATITPSGATTFCQGDSVTLSANTGTGFTYKWSLNGAIISGATASTYKAKPAGNYRVTVTNSNGCKDSSAITTITLNALPTATITPSGATTFCQGDSVTLSANTGAGLTYQWSLGGAIISGATTSTYKAKVAGNYRVIVTNSNGCKDSSAITAVTVNPLPAATITPSDSAKFCQGGAVTLNANTGTGLTYQWLLAGSPTGATGSSVNVGVAGNYSVTVTTSSGCKTTSAVVVVSKYALATATVTVGGATTFCAGDSVKLTASTAIGFTYQWKLNGSNISGATGSTYTATTSGTYTVQVTQNFCTGLGSVTSSNTVVTVNPMPTATITGSTNLCTGDSVILSANTGTGLTYQWQVGGTNISGQTASQLTVTSAGNYTVKVTKTGCTTTSTVQTVNLRTLPSASVSAGGPTTFCAGNSVLLTGNTGTGYTYQWKRNGTAIGSATSNTYSADSSGTYTVTITDSVGCRGTSSSTTVTVNTYPAATITPVGATTFCQGNTVDLNANTGSGLTYQWQLNGSNIPGSTSSSLNAISVAGSYVVVVTRNSCTTSSSPATVTVNARPPAGKLIIHE